MKSIFVLEDLADGSIIEHKRRLYCIQNGLDRRIVVDVRTGTWKFLNECNWKTFKLHFDPYEI